MFKKIYNILYKHQYRFHSKHSTIHPILQMQIADANDKTTKDITLAVFLDLSKALDTINHNALLYKLNHYRISRIRTKWFVSYISNRKQYIEINKSKLPLKKHNKWSTSRIHIRTSYLSSLY